MSDGANVETSGEGRSGVLWGESEEDASLPSTRAGRQTVDREHRSETEVFASEMDLASVSEVLANAIRIPPPIFSASCREGDTPRTGLPSDDSETGPDVDESASDVEGADSEEPELDPIRFIAFLGSGKTAVTIGTDGESQINLQVHPNHLDQVIELLLRRNRVLKVTIQ